MNNNSNNKSGASMLEQLSESRQRAIGFKKNHVGLAECEYCSDRAHTEEAEEYDVWICEECYEDNYDPC